MSAEGRASAPRTRRFRSANVVRPDPAMVARQSEAATVAFRQLGGDRARGYLNAPDPDLGGRPIDVAGASAEGLQHVLRAIGSVAPTAGG